MLGTSFEPHLLVFGTCGGRGGASAPAMTTVFEDNSLCKCTWHHDALSCALSDLDVLSSVIFLFFTQGYLHL